MTTAPATDVLEDVHPATTGAPTSVEAAHALLARAETLDLRDRDGNPLRPGALVHYVPRRQLEEDMTYGWPGSIWNTRRWGVVTGIARTAALDGDGHDLSVRVHAVDVPDVERAAWSNDEFFCSPTSLRVIPMPEATS